MKFLRFVFYFFFALFLALIAVLSLVSSYFDKSQEQIREELAGANVRHRFGRVAVDSLEIFYMESGDSLGQPIFFIHGSPGSFDNFFALLTDSVLADHFRMIAPDRPGFGNSQNKRGIISLNSQARILKHVMDQLGIEKPILVGHSLGGPLAAQIAADYPTIVGGLILAAGSFNPDLEPDTWYRPLAKVFPINLLIDRSLRTCNTELMTHQKDLTELSGIINQIKCPVIILQGDEDLLVDKENADFAFERLSSVNKKELWILEGENHFIPFNVEGVSKLKTAIDTMANWIRR